MPRHKNPNTPKLTPEDRRKALLDAALSLFCERGFYGTNVPDILASASVSAGAMYHKFASKEALVNSLFQRCAQEMEDALWGVALSGPFRKQFGELWQRLVTFSQQRPQVFLFLTMQHPGYLDEQSLQKKASSSNKLHQLFETAQQQGVVRPTPLDILLPVVWGAFIGLLQSKPLLSSNDTVEAERALWEVIRA